MLKDKEWCKSQLKNNFDKEDVIVIIDQLHQYDKKDYRQLYENETDIKIKEKYITYMRIDNIMSTIICIEKVVSGISSVSK